MKLDKPRVRGLMARRGMGIRRLWHEAQKFKPDLSEPTIWHAVSEEKDKDKERDVEADTAAAIAQALGCSMDWLYGLSDQVREGEPMQVESELTALVQRLNGLTPDQRKKLADIMSQLLDLTGEVYVTDNLRTSRMPGEIANTLNGALYAVSNPDVDVDTLAAIFDKMPAESIRRIQRIIDDWSAAQAAESTGDCELAPPKPARLFPDE